MAAYDLIIFDLDGTLIDSERVGQRVLMEVSSIHLRRPVTQEEAERFLGREIDFVLACLTQIHGAPLPDMFISALASAYATACKTELRATPGAREALEAICHLPLCVASNGEPKVIVDSLLITGLLSYFEGRLYSARQVAKPKPAPDLFLFAAGQAGVDPLLCLVIEDSVLGVQAARAAGMAVVVFAGNRPDRIDAFGAFDVPVLIEMAKLPELVLGGPSLPGKGPGKGQV